MSGATPLHKIRVTNPTGDDVSTKVEVDGVQQYVSAWDFSYNINSHGNADGTLVTLTYPHVDVEVELEQTEVKRRFSARLRIPGYEGITNTGYGDTIANALRDLASRLDASQ